jgi:hypothetical protein
MRQHEIVIDLEQAQLLAQTVLALARRSAAASNRRHPLPQTQIEAFNAGSIDLPAAGRQHLLDRRFRTKHHAVFDLEEPPPAQGFHDLRVEQLWQRHPAWLGHGAFCLAAGPLHPLPIMR